jgi:CRP-like cAMP-binding protein
MHAKNEPHALLPLLQKLAYRADFDEAEKKAILDLPFAIKRLERAQFLVREREAAKHSCVMLSGYSIRSKLVGSGNRQIVSIHMKGEVVDLQNSMLQTADHSVQMLTESLVAMIPRQAVIDLTLKHPRIGHAMWIDTLVDGSIFREWITNIGRRQARERMAHLLCEFSLRLRVAGLGADNEYELPMTQEQLADATGMTPVHVNRTIKTLEQEGLIERSNPRAIRIGDWRKLADAGDFDSNYLHLRSNEPALA